MTTQANYTPEEWKLLKETPIVVGAAVAAAAKSGLGTAKELLTVVTGTTGGIVEFPENALIQSLLREEDDWPNPFKDIKRDDLKAIALNNCRRVTAVLEQKAPTEGAEEYRRWVISVGEAVANAAKEGGFLGIGGDRISEREQSLLDEFATALRFGA